VAPPLILWALLACSRRPALSRAEVPDVIVLTVDTLRHDAVGDATPRISALATRGVRFTQATTPLPRTTPALASMLTGHLPAGHGSREVGEAISSGIPTVAARFAAAGYTTVGISGTPVAGPKQGLDAGFEHFAVHFDLPAPQLSAEALAHADTDRPLFLWVHYVDPHFPYLPPDAPPGPCRDLGQQAADGDLVRADLFTDRDGIASSALAHCRTLYALEVATADAGIGALLDGLEARGRRAGLVVVSADHGEHFGEEGIFYEHGPSVHDAALRVPLVVSGDGTVPHTDTGVARLEDLAPTLLAFAGLPPLPGTDGQDLTARLGGAAPPDDRIVAAESGGALHARFFLSLRSGRPSKRLCLNDPPWSLCAHRSGVTRLYNHVDDPALTADQTAARPDVVARLLAAEAHWPLEARQQTARDHRHKLTAFPLLEGGYRTEAATVGGEPAGPQPALEARLYSNVARE